MKKATKILAAAGAAAAAAAAVTVKTVSDYAINSRSRLFKDRHAGEEPLPQSERTERVTIRNSLGVTLTGHMLRVANPERIILAVHGWRSSWQHDFKYQCAMLEELNCDVLYIDQQAHGASGGKYIGFGIKERFDCLEWLNYIEAHNYAPRNTCSAGTPDHTPRNTCSVGAPVKDRLPVYLFGVSMGATTVMLASELIGSGRVNGIIADCGFTSAGDIWRYAINQKAKYGSDNFYRLSDLRCMLKAGYRGDTRSTVQALKNTDIPFLFIHGEDDKFVPTEMSRISYDSCVSEKKLVTVPGAKHARSCKTAPELYKTELTQFFEQYDNTLRNGRCE